MLAVVLYHSCMFFSGNWFDGAQPVYQAPYLYIVARWLNTFHVQTFTMASGFLFYYLCKEKGRYKNFKNDVLKRAKRLLLPYFLVIITWALPFYVYYSGANLEKIIYKYVLGCAPSQLWFLPMLFLLFVVFYEILPKDRVSPKGMAVVALISLGGGYLLDKAGFNVFQIAMAFKYAGYGSRTIQPTIFFRKFIPNHLHPINLCQNVLAPFAGGWLFAGCSPAYIYPNKPSVVPVLCGSIREGKTEIRRCGL